MASIKALAAIGLTLCLIIPIGLGYVLSIEEEPVTSWQTTSQSNISDLILNNQGPYFGSYKGTSNNSTLLGTETAAPEYISVTDNYSSLPIYDETTYTIQTAAQYTQYSRAWNAGSALYLLPTTEGYPDMSGFDYQVIGVHDIYELYAGEGIIYVFDDQDREYPVGSESGQHLFLYRNSDTTWRVFGTWESGDETITLDRTLSKFMIQLSPTGIPGIPNSRVYIRSADLTSIPTSQLPGVITATNGVVKIGDQYYQGYLNMQISSGEVIINGAAPIEYTETDVLKIAQTSQTNLISSGPTGQYADPSEGWTAVDASTNYTWVNNQLNQSVTFYVKPIHAPGQYATIGDLRIYAAGQNIEAYLLSQGPGTAQVLGAYDYLQVVVSTTGYTVSGLPAWPTMGTAPTLYNTLTFDRSSALFDALSIQTTHQGSNYWHFRVDNANIVQGYYPDTLDYTLNLDQLYPGAAVDVYINSIGLYGDSLSIGGINYAVDQSTGSITVNGAPARLLHAHLSAWQTDSGYSVRINGVEITTTQTLPQIYFGGEWSLTATAYKMEPVEDMQLTWHAGEFSLDKDSFAAAVVITAVLMILVLGMTGGRSMSKMGLLILVCGGAALVAMIML